MAGSLLVHAGRQLSLMCSGTAVGAGVLLPQALPASSHVCRTLFTSSHCCSQPQANPSQVPPEQQPNPQQSGTSQATDTDATGQQQGAGTSSQQDHAQGSADSSGGGAGPSSSSADSGSARAAAARSLLHDMAHEVKRVFRPADNIMSATSMYTGPIMDPAMLSNSSALAIVRQQQSTWDRVHERLMAVPLYAKLQGLQVKDSSAFKKGQELVEDLKEKYETSDHPVVHKVDEMRGRLLTGSESSRAMQEVHMRDPRFDLNNFVRAIKMDAPVVVKAFLKHDMDTLKLHMGPEMLERLAGIYKHDADKGLYEDPNILFTSDVEMVEVRLMDGDPFVVAQFHCQQVKCTRDKFGNVVDGATDTIQRVFYFWGLQQEKVGVITADGQLLPPRWVIKDMMWQSMLALV